ncbi:hypothetical protein TWF225_010700 [Orbilia oligospora]|nr:hypothetical protein TWF225_010700 [Orbilia oligospora]KAF3243676.1 hypothetical protein TWF217_011185 [Orbilia oligospora]KAF3281857.1 hypothetical protein TWF132_011079 [Orbilia oligospora]
MSKLSQIEAPLVRNRFMDREMEAYIKKWDDSQRLDDPHALEELFQDKYMMSNRETNSSIPEEKSGAEVDIQAELARYINECEALKLYIKMTDQRTCEQKRRWENEKQQYEGALQLASQKFNRQSFAPYQHSITQVVAPKVPRVPKVLEVPKTTGVAKVPKTTEVTKVPKNKKAAKVPKNTEAAKAPELKLDIVLTSKAPPETSWLQTWIDARSSKALGLADNAPNISSSDIPESLTKVDPVAYLRPTRARDLIWLPDLTVPGLMWGP